MRKLLDWLTGSDCYTRKLRKKIEKLQDLCNIHALENQADEFNISWIRDMRIHNRNCFRLRKIARLNYWLEKHLGKKTA